MSLKKDTKRRLSRQAACSSSGESSSDTFRGRAASFPLIRPAPRIVVARASDEMDGSTGRSASSSDDDDTFDDERVYDGALTTRRMDRRQKRGRRKPIVEDGQGDTATSGETCKASTTAASPRVLFKSRASQKRKGERAMKMIDAHSDPHDDLAAEAAADQLRRPFHSLRVVSQESQDEADTSDGVSPRRHSRSDHDDRVKMYDLFKTLVRTLTEGSKKDEITRGKGRNVYVGAHGRQQKFDEVLWLQLQAYLKGDQPMRNKDEMEVASQAYDELIMQRRRERMAVREEIMNFRFSHLSSCAHSPLVDGASPNDSSDVEGAKPMMFSLSSGRVNRMASDSRMSASLAADVDSSVFCGAFFERQSAALEQVHGLLHSYEAFEKLYPNTETMRHLLGKEFFSDAFKSRLNVLYVWSNLTRNLCRTIKAVGRMFNMDKSSGGQTDDERSRGIPLDWPYLDYCSEASSCSDDDDGDSTGGADEPRDRTASFSMAALSESSRNASELEIVSSASAYRGFVEKSLRLRGMRGVLRRVDAIAGVPLDKARRALSRRNTYAEAAVTKPPPPRRSMPITPQEYHWSVNEAEEKAEVANGGAVEESLRLFRKFAGNKILAQLTEFGVEHPDFKAMNLPSFYPAFLFLLRIPVALAHEWLKLRGEQTKAKQADTFSLEALIQDCHDCLEAAVEVKCFYQEYVQSVVWDDETRLDKLLVSDMQQFDEDLGAMFKAYLEYVDVWGVKQATYAPSSSADAGQMRMQRLRDEWKFAKKIAINVLSGESDAAQKFCGLGKTMFEDHMNYWQQEYDERRESGDDSDDEDEARAAPLSKANWPVFAKCRAVKRVLLEFRERALRALTFAKLLSTDLEICTKYSLADRPVVELLNVLCDNGYVLVTTPHSPWQRFLMLCPKQNASDEEHLQLLLNVTCGRDDLEIPHRLVGIDGNLLLVNCGTDAKDGLWNGPTQHILPDADTTIALQYMQVRWRFASAMLLVALFTVDAVYLVVVNSNSLPRERATLKSKVPVGYLELVVEQVSCHEIIAENIHLLKECAWSMRRTVADALQSMAADLCSGQARADLQETEHKAFVMAVIQGFNFSFEYHRELAKLMATTVKSRPSIANTLRAFVHQWSEFVQQNVHRGHTIVPRWAFPGLHFLVFVKAPDFAAYLTDDECEAARLQQLEADASAVVQHLVGEQSSASGGHVSRMLSTPLLVADDAVQSRSRTKSAPVLVPPADGCSNRRRLIRQKLRDCDKLKNYEKMEGGQIGHVVDRRHDRIAVFPNRAPFHWSRLEKKIGAGMFGDVYVALNLDTGQLMAMKQLKPKTSWAELRRRDGHNEMTAIANEINNLRKMNHPNLVRYYGVEVQRDGLLIFMEYCTGGTLEQICREGIGEALVRTYAHFLLRAVVELHQHVIVHRDIKPANIFLSTTDAVLKLGDFGSTVRLQATATVAGELTAHVGSPVYMAPEVCTSGAVGGAFTGYGRAVDIWSVGCVVLEMVTGKPPWYDLPEKMAVIFRVGSGQSPAVPKWVDPQCADFLAQCFVHEPSKRATANQLADHPFAKVVPTSNDV